MLLRGFLLQAVAQALHAGLGVVGGCARGPRTSPGMQVPEMPGPSAVPSPAGTVQVGSLELLVPAPRLSFPLRRLWRRSLLQSEPGFAAFSPLGSGQASAKSQEGGRSICWRQRLLCVGDSSRFWEYAGCRMSGLISKKRGKMLPSLSPHFPVEGSRCAIL